MSSMASHLDCAHSQVCRTVDPSRASDESIGLRFLELIVLWLTLFSHHKGLLRQVALVGIVFGSFMLSPS